MKGANGSIFNASFVVNGSCVSKKNQNHKLYQFDNLSHIIEITITLINFTKLSNKSNNSLSFIDFQMHAQQPKVILEYSLTKAFTFISMKVFHKIQSKARYMEFILDIY